MTFNSKHFEFLSDFTRVMSKDTLEIPITPDEHRKDPAQKIVPGDTFAIFVVNRSVCGIYRAEAWTNASPTTPRELRLIDQTYNTPMYLSPWQISWLNKQGRIRTVRQEARKTFDNVLPGSALSLTAYQFNSATRVLDYIDHYRLLCQSRNKGLPSAKLMDEARAEVGERRGEKPLGKTAIYEALNKLMDRQNMDRVCAVAPPPNIGNSVLRFNPRLEEAMQKAVHTAWRDPRGSARSVASSPTTIQSDPTGHCAKRPWSLVCHPRGSEGS
jgi:putative transposase